MRCFKIIILILFCFSFIIGEKWNKQYMNAGILENNIYRNEYMGISLTFPINWVFEDAKQTKELEKRGEEILSAGSSLKKAQLAAANLNNYTLCFSSKYGVKAKKLNNPMFIAAAEKVSVYPQITDGKTYHKYTRKLLKNAGQKILTPITKETINGVEFAVFMSQPSRTYALIKQVCP